VDVPDRYVIRHDERPFTANAASRGTTPGARRAHAAKVKSWRRAFEMLARSGRVPALGPCEVIVRTYLPDRRGTHDVGACFPAYKAAQDGLVDAGVWPDDKPQWVVRVIFEAPVFGQGAGLELELVPVEIDVAAKK
jgi:hypothetical protein